MIETCHHPADRSRSISSQIGLSVRDPRVSICRRNILRAIVIGSAGLLATPAAAHLSPGEYGSFAAGFSHPLFGPDHLLAMVAVGLWASVIGGKALWIVPATFVAAMVCGFVLALLGAPLPLVEPMILASVVVIGLLIALAARLDIGFGALIVGVFALFHGHAHGGELGAATAAQFGAGFICGTALLHAAGVGLGMALGRISSAGSWLGGAAVGATGVATAVAGLTLVAI